MNNLLVKSEIEERWIVSYGPAREGDRERKTFYDQNAAFQFFNLKSVEMHVSAYKETLVRTIEKVG
jgi:hypothetical protein